jgi:hypothetical protein
MLKWEPHAGSGCKNLQACANIRIGVAQLGKGLSVEFARRRRRRIVGKVLFFKELVARPLGVKSRVVDDGPGLVILAAAGQHGQLLFGGRLLAGKTKQLE